ncbi:MAG TPA: hypothetical protein VFU02_07670 [Polyangiaceae bacterium]|nr:hypothetical protein [Polyangiaceae bacterium]
MSACLAGGLLLSAYACGGDKSGGSGDDDGNDAAGGSGGSGGDGAGGSSGEAGTGGSDTSSGGNSTTASGGSSSTSGGNAGEGGSGGTPEIECTEDADCENADMVCDPLTEVCVGCLFDSDCGADERCERTTCVESVACTSSTDCEGVAGAEACDTIAGHCVECVSSGDCPSTADCIQNQCRPYQTCTNSLDCPSSRVCNPSTQRCAQCVSDNDCDEAQHCVSNSCRRSCSSDNDCTSLGLLCDFTYQACARCISDSDCPAPYHCALGRCELDSCETGSGYCQGNYLYSCNASGSGYYPTSCYYNQTCVEGEQPTCQDLLCTPGATECSADSSQVITCSADGLSIESSVDCTETDEICHQGSCQDLACPPLEEFCQDGSVYYCYSDGITSAISETCYTGQYCEDSGTTVQCVDLLCTPDEPACNGSLATTCNAAGDGYVDGGTDCSETEEFCVNGECQECNSSILLLGDTDATGNTIMQDALENAGMVVTLVSGGTSTYAGSPALADFGAVINAVGTSYSSPMPQAGQDALVAAHAAGVGYVTYEWASYQAEYYAPTLAPLTLLNYTTGYTTSSFTLTSSGHPIWDGLPTTFTTTSSISGAAGPIVNSGVAIATCTGCETGGNSGAAVVVREGSGGRLVHLTQLGTSSSFYNDANLLTMFVNAAQWAAGCK